MNNNTKIYLNVSKEVSIISFFEYLFIKKYTAAIIFLVITLLGLLVIFYSPLSKKTYTVSYDIYKSQNDEQYHIINSNLNLVNNELIELGVFIDKYNIGSDKFIDEFNNYLNNNIFLYNFFSDQFDNKKNNFNDKSEFTNFLHSKINSLKSVIDFQKISLNFITDDLKNDREMLSKLLIAIELQLKNDVLVKLISLKNLNKKMLKIKMQILNNQISNQTKIYNESVKRHLIYLNEQKLIAKYVDEYGIDRNIHSLPDRKFPMTNSDQFDLSLYFTKGLSVIEKEIEILQSRKSNYIPIESHRNLNDLIRLENKDDSKISEIIDMFNSDLINIPFVKYENNIPEININNSFSILQMIVFLFLLSSILTPFIMAVILAYERTNQKIN